MLAACWAGRTWALLQAQPGLSSFVTDFPELSFLICEIERKPLPCKVVVRFKCDDICSVLAMQEAPISVPLCPTIRLDSSEDQGKQVHVLTYSP